MAGLVVRTTSSCCGRRFVAASMASQLRYVGLRPLGVLSKEHVSKMACIFLDEKCEEVGSVDSESWGHSNHIRESPNSSTPEVYICTHIHKGGHMFTFLAGSRMWLGMQRVYFALKDTPWASTSEYIAKNEDRWRALAHGLGLPWAFLRKDHKCSLLAFWVISCSAMSARSLPVDRQLPYFSIWNSFSSVCGLSGSIPLPSFPPISLPTSAGNVNVIGGLDALTAILPPKGPQKLVRILSKLQTSTHEASLLALSLACARLAGLMPDHSDTCLSLAKELGSIGILMIEAMFLRDHAKLCSQDDPASMDDTRFVYRSGAAKTLPDARIQAFPVE